MQTLLQIVVSVVVLYVVWGLALRTIRVAKLVVNAFGNQALDKLEQEARRVTEEAKNAK